MKRTKESKVEETDCLANNNNTSDDSLTTCTSR